jgi:conjugative transfer signal peptidase TraF
MNPGSRSMMVTAGGVSAALALTALIAMPKWVAYNPTSSAALGFYRLTDPGPPKKGAEVLAQLPPYIARLASERRYLPIGVPVLKRIAADPGATVCRDGAIVTVDSVVAARALPRDRAGRPLPVWSGCRRLGPGEVFLLSGTDPAAFDGRYFGPVPAASIRAEAHPLWTW